MQERRRFYFEGLLADLEAARREVRDLIIEVLGAALGRKGARPR